VNLADIETAGLVRGDVLSEPGRFRAVTHVDCRLQLLPSAKPLKHRAPVHFHAGTAEIGAEVRLLGGATKLEPGNSALVRMVLHRAALLLPGDRFIIRMFSPVITIGGGVVLDLPVTLRSSGAAERLTTLEKSDEAGRIALHVRDAEFGAGVDELVARTGWTKATVIAAAARAALMALGESWYVDPVWFQSARGKLVDAVRVFHRENPLAAGVAKQDLRAREMPRVPPFVLDALLAAAPEIAVEGETVRLKTHKVVLQEEEEQARNTIERAFEAAGLAVPPMGEVLAASGVETKRARTLLEALIRQKRLLRINRELVFHASAIERLRRILLTRKSQHFGVGEFKEWTGISRKYAIPLLEYLDREHLTRREGDRRLIL
jgi:selenocysteine-specific elongation factor